MADEELKELRKLKASLVKKVCELREELKRNESNPQAARVVDLLLSANEEPKGPVDSISMGKETTRLCDVSQSILSVQFKDIKKSWIRDNIYHYKAEAITKAVQFAFDLTVDVEEKRFTIQDINCDFESLDECYLREITPWVERFTGERNFSYLISGISDYSDQSIIRAKILRVLEKKDYISMEMCSNEGGGIYVYVHPPGADERIFFKFLWSTEFVDRSWRIEHIFAITPIEAGEAFVKANEDLLQSFCQIGLRKADLEDRWDRLCTAIDDNKD